MTPGLIHPLCLSAFTQSGTGIAHSGCCMKVLSFSVFLEGNREQQGAKTKCFYSGFLKGLQKGHIHPEAVQASRDNSSCYHQEKPHKKNILRKRKKSCPWQSFQNLMTDVIVLLDQWNMPYFEVLKKRTRIRSESQRQTHYLHA